MSGPDPNLRPARLSAAAAVLLSLAALAVVAPAGVVPALGVEVAGLALLAAGTTLVHRDWRAFGSVLALLGLGVVVGAVAFLWATTGDHFLVVQFAPGMLGAALVAAGVVPFRGEGSTRLVKLGTALVFVTVLAVGIVQRPTRWVLLGSGVLVVLSWDAGENAIGLGAQVGRRARTAAPEAVHLLGTAVVGAIAVGGGQLAIDVGSPGLPLGAFAILVIGLVLLAGALHG